MAIGESLKGEIGQRLRCENCGASFIVTHPGNRPECCGRALAAEGDQQPRQAESGAGRPGQEH
jgi:hypothetical protein